MYLSSECSHSYFSCISKPKHSKPNWNALPTTFFFFLYSVAPSPIYSLRILLNSSIFTPDTQIFKCCKFFTYSSIQFILLYSHYPIFPPFFSFDLYFPLIRWMMECMNPSSTSLKFSIIFHHIFISVGSWKNALHWPAKLLFGLLFVAHRLCFHCNNFNVYFQDLQMSFSYMLILNL